MKHSPSIVLTCLFFAHALYALEPLDSAFQPPLTLSEVEGQTRACSTAAAAYAYALKLPATQGNQYQVMGLIDGNGDLGWLTTVTNTQQINLLATATSADIPLTLVLRDASGSFVATNVTVTGAAIYQAANGGMIFTTAPSSVVTYTLFFPIAQSAISQTLVNDGSGHLFWQNIVAGSYVESLNTATAANQFLTTSTVGAVLGFTTISSSTNQLNLPYVANLGANNNAFGLLTGADYTTFETTYTTVQTATPFDIPNTLVRRDGTGSFAVTNLTLTGTTNFQAQNGATISLSAPSSVTTYTLTWPAAAATSANQALVNNGSGGLSWVTTITGIQSINGQSASQQYLSTSTIGTTLGFTTLGTATNQLTIPYAGNLGTNNNAFGLITGADYTNFENTYTTVKAATAFDTPTTLVIRDNTGSFAATTITVTAVIFQGQGGALTLTATTLPGNQTFVWPLTAPQTGQALSYNGNNQLSWVTTLTGGIQSLNGQTAAQQYLTTSTAGTTLGFTTLGTATNQLTIPYAGNLGSSSLVGLITGADYTNFENTYTTVLAATPNDTANSLVRRDATGSFVATNITTTGFVGLQSVTGNLVYLYAPSTLTSYSLTLPPSSATASTVLSNNGSGQLSWVASLATGTTCNLPLYTAARDATGSFAATTITLTGKSVINYSTIGGCDLGAPYIWAPQNNNTAIGLGIPSSIFTFGTDNTILGQGSGTSITSGSLNTIIGQGSGTALASGSSNVSVGYGSQVGNANYCTTVGAQSGSATNSQLYNTIVGAQSATLMTTGGYNTVLGQLSGTSVTSATQLTLIGAQAGNEISSASSALAIGFGAHAGNVTNLTIGANAGNVAISGASNIIVGAGAATSLTGGVFNTIVGQGAATALTTAGYNTLVGQGVMNSGYNNTVLGAQAQGGGHDNTVVGCLAGTSLGNGGNNVVLGAGANVANSSANIVIGYGAGSSSLTNGPNVIIGQGAGTSITTGYNNVVIGVGAGSGSPAIGAGINNIYIGAGVNPGTAGESNTTRIGYYSSTTETACYIQGVAATGSTSGYAPVAVNSAGQLSTAVSSRRFKHAIKAMGDRTNDLINLNPVTFTYITDDTDELQYGLIAEEVEPYYPELIAYGKDGSVYSVMYQFLPPMLLDVLQKDHISLQTLDDTLADLEMKIDMLVNKSE